MLATAEAELARDQAVCTAYAVCHSTCVQAQAAFVEREASRFKMSETPQSEQLEELLRAQRTRYLELQCVHELPAAGWTSTARSWWESWRRGMRNLKLNGSISKRNV